MHVVGTGTVAQVRLPTYLGRWTPRWCWRPRESRSTTRPLKLAEYLAAGVPVVAPAVDQLCELLTDGVDAMLVPPHDTEALAPPSRLQHDPAERIRIGHAGQQLARSGWSWAHQVRRLLDALPGLTPLPGRGNAPPNAHSATVPVSGRAVRCLPWRGVVRRVLTTCRESKERTRDWHPVRPSSTLRRVRGVKFETTPSSKPEPSHLSSSPTTHRSGLGCWSPSRSVRPCGSRPWRSTIAGSWAATG